MPAGKFAALAAVFALLTITAPARAADFMTVGDLQGFCTASDDGSKSACRFFIFGVAQGMRLAATLGAKPLSCIPDDLSSAAMELAVKLAIGGIRFRRPHSSGARSVGA
jgi:hypothetical protein